MGAWALALNLGLHSYRSVFWAPGRCVRCVPDGWRRDSAEVCVRSSLSGRCMLHRRQSLPLTYRLFCISTFALNFGPNVSTYVLPASSFPQQVCRSGRSVFANTAMRADPLPEQIRGTFHGLSAASGKLGAVFGTFVYPILQSRLGLASIMWMQVAVSLVGAVISVVFLKPYYPPGVSPAARGTLRAWLEYLSLAWA